MNTIKFKDVVHLYAQSGLSVMFRGRYGNTTYHSGADCEEMISATAYYGGDTHNDYEYTPILRPASSITEDERKELWRLVFSQGEGRRYPNMQNFRGRSFRIEETERKSKPRWIMMQGVERLAIEDDGHVWADCDLNYWRFCHAPIVEYLTRIGIDLFGLIDSGEALDAKTVGVGKC